MGQKFPGHGQVLEVKEAERCTDDADEERGRKPGCILWSKLKNAQVRLFVCSESCADLGGQARVGRDGVDVMS